ncbi:MAG: ATP-dependent sacrificial sulfur transferase LarE [Chthoniobacteraceae bacterium]|nr:ATP-dependent sacrificial sulfur transferase LarE [Chthoniobacteraceae bacterium]
MTPPHDAALEVKCAALADLLRAHRPLLIAYSGGVDSTYLLAFARRTLGREGMLGVIADSPSLPRKGLADALALAGRLDAPVETLATGEMENPDYAKNPFNRCYFCKAELFARMEALAAQRRFAALAYGENAEDPADTRPGSQAAREFAVLAPLRQAGLTKAEIRRLSREMGLPTADAPSQPCLSSRIPFGTPVTRQALAMVEAGEAHVRSLGFRVLRVRHLVAKDGSAHARVQVGRDEMDRLPPLQAALEAGLRAVGYAAVEIDPQGYRITEMPSA